MVDGSRSRNSKAIVSFQHSSDLSKKLALCLEQSGYPGTNLGMFSKDKILLRLTGTTAKKDSSGCHRV